MSFNPLDHHLCFEKPRRLTDIASWHEHIPFAFTIMQMLKPKIFVELGTHKGDSYCAFCQAVDTLGIDAACYAIDTWKGDEHAGFYEYDILEELRKYHDPIYGHFSQLIQCTFDQAAEYFSDNSVDLLHIDGLHTYDAVKHDFENWLPKMSVHGVILLHDINVREREFGVWKLWEELKDKYGSLEFKHGHGLGVLIVGTDIPRDILTLLYAKEQNLSITKFFSELGNKIVLDHKFESDIQSKDIKIGDLENGLRAKGIKIGDLENSSRTKDIKIGDLENSIQSKDIKIVDLENSVQYKDIKIVDLESDVQSKDVNIVELKSDIQSKNAKIEDLENNIQYKDTQISNLNGGTVVLNNKLNSLESSLGFRFVHYVRLKIGKIFPDSTIRGDFRRIVLRSIRIIADEGIRSYFRRAYLKIKRGELKTVCKRIENIENRDAQLQIWIARNEPSSAKLEQYRKDVKNFKYRPKISIITPVYNPDIEWIKAAVESVLSQAYDNWELCIADASTKEAIKKCLKNYAEKDSRIKVKFLVENKGIAENSNEALSIATGEYIGLLDHDDEISPDALYEVVKYLQDNDADMIYSDEDKIDINGNRTGAFFKPDWSLDMFLSLMYTCHFGVYNKKIIDDIGGFRVGYNGSQDYDLVLRFVEKANNIHHIPKILYHWRMVPGSVAEAVDAKNYAYVSAKKALTDYIGRNNICGEILDGTWKGSYRLRRELCKTPLVSIIIPTKDRKDVLKKCIDSILGNTSYTNYEIIVVDNNSTEKDTCDYFEELKRETNIKILQYKKDFNFSAINNFAVKNASGDVILFLNNDTEIISKEWINAMVEHIQRDEVGIVGCKLLYANDKIQHAGVILGIGGVAGHSHKYFQDSDPGYLYRPHIIQNVSAVTAACMMIRKDVFESVGGFDENIVVAFGDVDLCLKIVDKGYMIVYTPYAKLYHHESLSRGYEDNPEKQERFSREVKYIREKWGNTIDKGDPYYSHNLTLIKEDFSIGI